MSASATRQFLKKIIKTTSVLVLSKANCPACQKVESIFATYEVKPTIIHIDGRHDETVISGDLKRMTGDTIFPKMFIGGSYFGGKEDIEALHRDGVLADFVKKGSLYCVRGVTH